jgi:hypothetical protein
VVIWYIFPHFGMFGPRKIWQPWSGLSSSANQIFTAASFSNIFWHVTFAQHVAYRQPSQLKIKRTENDTAFNKVHT